MQMFGGSATTAGGVQENFARTAEKLIILLDYSNGLLTRLHACVNYKPGPIQDTLARQIIDALSREREDPTANLNRTNGFDVISMKAEAIEHETRFTYETTVDILTFTNVVEPLLQTLVNNIMTFDLHMNTDLTTRFVGVFINYVKIHLLAGRMDTARISTYLYTMAYREHNRTDPEEAHMVKKFLFDNLKPILQLQTKLNTAHNQRVGESLGDALQQVVMSFYTWTSYDSLKQGQYFYLSQNPEQLGNPVQQDLELYQDAAHIDTIGEWIIYLYLVFPDRLSDERARGYLQAALNDRTVVILFRDEVLDVLSEFSQIQKTSRKDVRVPSGEIARLIKKANSAEVAQRHSQMRELLRREIRGLLDVCHALPGCIPVKLPILLAGLALARYEILWICTHLACPRASKYRIRDEHLDAPFLADLMFHTHKLSQTLLEAKQLIHDYYRDQLNIDLQQIAPFVQELRQGQVIDPQIVQKVEYIVQQVGELIQTPPHVKLKSLEGLRLNWYRASSDLSKEPSPLLRPEGKQLVKLVNPLIEHTRYFDRLDKEVDARGSMAVLWFFRPYLAQVFNSYCLGKIDIERMKNAGNDFVPFRQGRYWIVFLQIFSQALLNVHRHHPRELREIGEQVLNKAEAYLKGATSKIEVCLRVVLAQMSALKRQIHPETVAEFMLRPRRERGPLPGEESKHSHRRELAELEFNLNVIGDMCASFREVDTLLIWNVKLHPAAYLYQQLHEFLYQELRVLVQKDQQTMVRPSRFYGRLQRLLKTMHTVGMYINIDLETMVKKSLYDDFFDEMVGTLGCGLGIPAPNVTAGDKRQKLIHDIRDWYLNLVENRCAEPINSSAIWSPILSGFYEGRVRALSGNTPPVEDYCSLTELEYLCRVIGPSGVRVIDAELVKVSLTSMKEIQKAFRANKPLIEGVDMVNFHGRDAYRDITRRFRGLNTISEHAIRVGSVIVFRELLRKALKNVVYDQEPFMARSAQLLHDRLLHNRTFVQEFNDMSLDFGIMSEYSDSMMRQVIQQFGQAEEDKRLWQYIPLVFGICFISNIWKSARFKMQLGALSNNGFVIADTIHLLISIFCGPDPNNIRQQRLRWLNLAGKTFLYMKQWRLSHRTDHLMLILDYFVERAPDLTPIDLDTVGIPSDMIRAQIVRAFGDGEIFTDANANNAGDDDDEKGD